jgi:hypothetical protein
VQRKEGTQKIPADEGDVVKRRHREHDRHEYFNAATFRRAVSILGSRWRRGDRDAALRYVLTMTEVYPVEAGEVADELGLLDLSP